MVNLPLGQPRNGPHVPQELKWGSECPSDGTPKVQEPQKVGVQAPIARAEGGHLVMPSGEGRLTSKLPY